MLLNVSIFVWYGAVCPWYSFAHSTAIPIYRLIFIAVLVLLFRRLPIVLAMHKRIHQIEEWRQAFFVGFFGPMGVSAIFYLYTSREFLRQITYQGHERADAERLAEIFDVVVWFMVIASVVRFSLPMVAFLSPLTPLNPKLPQVVHGLSIPLGKVGYHLPRTLSGAIGDDSEESGPSRSRQAVTNEEGALEAGRTRLTNLEGDVNETQKQDPTRISFPQTVRRIGGTIMEGPKPQPGD